MKFSNLYFFILILTITEITSLSRGLYYGKKKCFYDNYYNQMNILITYKVLDKDIKLSKVNR